MRVISSRFQHTPGSNEFIQRNRTITTSQGRSEIIFLIDFVFYRQIEPEHVITDYYVLINTARLNSIKKHL